MKAEPQPVSDFLAEFAARSIQIHHPHYMGHQVCAPAPAAVLAGLTSELLNNGMAVYEMGPATALERRGSRGCMAAESCFPRETAFSPRVARLGCSRRCSVRGRGKPAEMS